MARPWSRKRGGDSSEPAERAAADPTSAGEVHLDDDDHAWWSRSEVEDAWKAKVRPAPREDSTRDILAEHFGSDWRTNFLGPPTEEELAEQRAADDSDPYRVLQVDPSATWDEIVAAHRHQVRVHHPDRLFGQSEEEQAESDERIRVINAAYEELKVRRGV